MHVQPHPDPGPATLPTGRRGQRKAGGLRGDAAGLKLFTHVESVFSTTCKGKVVITDMFHFRPF